MADDKSKLVTVYTSNNAAMVSIIKPMLDEAGIEYFAKGETWHQTIPVESLSDIEIQVNEKDAEKAKQLITELEDGYNSFSDEDLKNDKELNPDDE